VYSLVKKLIKKQTVQFLSFGVPSNQSTLLYCSISLNVEEVLYEQKGTGAKKISESM
jgi:hypothetical protein